MISREFDNGLLKKNWATVEDIESFIKDIAEENLRAEGKGVSVDDVAELAPLSLSPTIGEAEIDEAVQQIQQLPFFAGSIDLGRLSFSQEVVYDYLLGTLATDYFSSNPKRFLHLLGVVPFSPSSVTVHVIREHVQAINGPDDLYRIALDATPDRVAFRNVLQILLTLPGTEWIIRRLPLERRDLSGLHFEGMDLSGLSFRSANLESSTFQTCTLTTLVLADAVIKGTKFTGCTGLDSADFGDLSTFFSAVVDGDGLDEPDQFLRAAGVAIGSDGPRYIRPCRAARQLRFLFSKYVRPDGIARRNWLDERGAAAGRRYIDPRTVLDAARRYGYLEWDPVRKRYTRSVGEQYSEMIGLVSKDADHPSAASFALRRVLTARLQPRADRRPHLTGQRQGVHPARARRGRPGHSRAGMPGCRVMPHNVNAQAGAAARYPPYCASIPVGCLASTPRQNGSIWARRAWLRAWLTSGPAAVLCEVLPGVTSGRLPISTDKQSPDEAGHPFGGLKPSQFWRQGKYSNHQERNECNERQSILTSTVGPQSLQGSTLIYRNLAAPRFQSRSGECPIDVLHIVAHDPHIGGRQVCDIDQVQCRP